MKKTWVDHGACVSCGLCVTNVPEVFRFGTYREAEVYNPVGVDTETIQTEAIDICPAACIYWQE